MSVDRKALAAEALRFSGAPGTGAGGLAVLFDVVANDALEEAAVAIEREAESPEHAAQIVRAMKHGHPQSTTGGTAKPEPGGAR